MYINAHKKIINYTKYVHYQPFPLWLKIIWTIVRIRNYFSSLHVQSVSSHFTSVSLTSLQFFFHGKHVNGRWHIWQVRYIQLRQHISLHNSHIYVAGINPHIPISLMNDYLLVFDMDGNIYQKILKLCWLVHHSKYTLIYYFLSP